MATSFRLPPEQMTRLTLLAKTMGTSKAQVVKQAIDRLYEEQSRRSKRSLLDRLLEGGFEPLAINVPQDLSSNEEKQRRIIREKLAKKNRR
jgi:hypothetical protein